MENAKQKRILSIDAFRGVTVFMMIFVNDLAKVEGIPAWMKHRPAGIDSMTFVDVIFPAFLFMVGMAIPFSTRSWLSKNPNKLAFGKHVLLRTVSLLILGVYLVNAKEMNPEASVVSKCWWAFLLYVASILIWNVYPKAMKIARSRICFVLRLSGVAILVMLYFFYRKGSGETLVGMTTSWWGFLGMIGWAYFLSMLAYIGTGKRLAAMVGVAALFLVMALGLQNDALWLPGPTVWLRDQAGHFIHAFVGVTGILASLLLIRGKMESGPIQGIKNILIMGTMLAIAGFFIRPFGGLGGMDCPGLALYGASISCYVFGLLSWLIDVKGVCSWTKILRPMSENPLFSYLLHLIFYFIVGGSMHTYLPDIFNEGLLGFIRAVAFAVMILYMVKAHLKLGVRLHL